MDRTKEFTKDELDFLFSKIERGTILIEKERIDITRLRSAFETFHFNGKKYLNYEKPNFKSDEIIKKKIIDTLLTCKDFEIESLGCDYETYGYELVIYDTIEETEEDYMIRLKTLGREIIRKERAKQKINSSREARKVLFEKTKKKISKPKKEYPIPMHVNMYRYNDFGLRIIPYPEDVPF
jgi:hypothetical protein